MRGKKGIDIYRDILVPAGKALITAVILFVMFSIAFGQY